MLGTMTPVVLALKEARERCGLTQSALADAVGVRQATISDLETGKSRRIDLDLLDRLAQALDVEPGSLFVGTPARRKQRKGK